jgi:SAM-dependent methyltransferase
MSAQVSMDGNDTLAPYFAGDRLYGDDFSPAQIEEWYDDEKEGYADLGAGDAQSYRYVYHALNEYHGFKHLRPGVFPKVLGMGSAYGDEFVPLRGRIGELTIVDPSEAFATAEGRGVPAKYVKPEIDGALPFVDGTFDLVTCLGVLHHIPNVTRVISEMARCTAPGGQVLVREPVVSMGDWRKPRRGLTRRERGIPDRILLDALQSAGLRTVRAAYCMFPLVLLLGQKLSVDTFNSAAVTRLDAILSLMFRWNLRYHSDRLIHKFRPTSMFYLGVKE